MLKLTRRDFIFTAGMAGAGAFAFHCVEGRAALLDANASRVHLTNNIGYGPLFPTKANNTGETLLALPKGFQYTVIGKTGDIMSDGRPTPPRMTEWLPFEWENSLG